MRNKILSLLVLLLTAASGAWAAEVTVTWEGSTLESINVSSYGTTKTQTIGDITITANSGYFQTTTDSGTGSKATTASAFGANGLVFSSEKNIKSVEVHASDDSTFGGTSSGGVTSHTYTLNPAATSFAFPYGDGWVKITKIVFTLEEAEPAVKVTTNAASEGATFTEASFAMPAFDATAEYELVRDMSVQMTAQVGDGTQEQPRYRVKKDSNNKFIPADMDMAAVPALFTVNDAIEQKALTQTQDYIVQIYAIDAEGQPTGQPMTFATFTFEPGIYAVKAVAAQGSDYDGETALSNTFKLFQGYEVTIPAGEYATYYKDENLYTEDEDAVLYTIANVTATEAQLSDAIKVAPAETPLLVYNKSEQDKTFLLIPTTNDADEVIPAKEFKGSITSGELPASSSTADYYALNGKAFVWVKYTIEIGANKCWLQISNQPAAARASSRAITRGLGGIDGTTGIDAIENVTIDNEGWYDLQGRKLQSAPNRKGIYIHNGRKVVVH